MNLVPLMSAAGTWRCESGVAFNGRPQYGPEGGMGLLSTNNIGVPSVHSHIFVFHIHI